MAKYSFISSLIVILLRNSSGCAVSPFFSSKSTSTVKLAMPAFLGCCNSTAPTVFNSCKRSVTLQLALWSLPSGRQGRRISRMRRTALLLLVFSLCCIPGSRAASGRSTTMTSWPQDPNQPPDPGQNQQYPDQNADQGQYPDQGQSAPYQSFSPEQLDKLDPGRLQDPRLLRATIETIKTQGAEMRRIRS